MSHNAHAPIDSGQSAQADKSSSDIGDTPKEQKIMLSPEVVRDENGRILLDKNGRKQMRVIYPRYHQATAMKKGRGFYVTIPGGKQTRIVTDKCYKNGKLRAKTEVIFSIARTPSKKTKKQLRNERRIADHEKMVCKCARTKAGKFAARGHKCPAIKEGLI